MRLISAGFVTVQVIGIALILPLRKIAAGWPRSNFGSHQLRFRKWRHYPSAVHLFRTQHIASFGMDRRSQPHTLPGTDSR